MGDAMIPRGSLPLRKPPEDLWARIQGEMDRPQRQSWRQWGMAAALAASLIGGWFYMRASRPTWNVVRVVAGRETPGRVTEGDWIETGANGTARIEVGSIGTVDVEPDSRVRVVVAKTNEHRLQLGQGAIDATITAPPRLFFVGTAATTAIDLGCAYRMESDAAGNGVLHVRVGWVALDKGAGEVMVPSGASCRIREKRGAGTPYFDDSSQEFRAALAEFDESGQGLDGVLILARDKDTMTLWHLLPQVGGSDRERVFDRMAALVPLAPGVTREKALALDQDTLNKWREELAWRW
jgi:hypothetical protein